MVVQNYCRDNIGEKPMEYVMNLLAGLGDHFVLIAVGCIEAAVAAVFVGM